MTSLQQEFFFNHITPGKNHQLMHLWPSPHLTKCTIQAGISRTYLYLPVSEEILTNSFIYPLVRPHFLPPFITSKCMKLIKTNWVGWPSVGIRTTAQSVQFKIKWVYMGWTRKCFMFNLLKPTPSSTFNSALFPQRPRPPWSCLSWLIPLTILLIFGLCVFRALVVVSYGSASFTFFRLDKIIT
jgi:hypothetical protein